MIKRIFLSLLGMSGVAMGTTTDSYTLFTTDRYGQSSLTGASSPGIAFTLGAVDTERFTLEEGAQPAENTLDSDKAPKMAAVTLPYDAVTLTSISLLERPDAGDEIRNIPEGYVLFITDGNNKLLSISDARVKDGDSNIVLFNFNNSITLNTTDTYYAYFADGSVSTGPKVGDTITKGDIISQQLAAVGGQYASGNGTNWGILNGMQSFGVMSSYAPVMSIVVAAAPVPEPTVVTLSLLALCGLAARRRRA